MRGLGVGLGRREAVAERVHRLVEERNRTLHGVHLFTSSLLLLEGFAGAVVSRLAGVVSWRFVGKQPASLLMPSSKIEEIFEFSGGEIVVFP